VLAVGHGVEFRLGATLRPEISPIVAHFSAAIWETQQAQFARRNLVIAESRRSFFAIVRTPHAAWGLEGIDMAMLSNLDLIRRVPLFSRLTDAQAAAVSGAIVKRRYKRGEKIVEQGRKSNSLFIMLTGRARVISMDNRGREVILATLQPGDYIGEMSLIDNEPHSASVQAEVQTDVLELARNDFARCLPENNSMAYAVMKGLVQRLRHADQQIESLALMDVYGRVARALLEFAVPDNAGHMIIREKISRSDIAKMVGASREMVSRVMKDLEERGFVETLENGAMLIKEHLGPAN
jgi:CRP/FNR family cyclic AMP-dependent transcriptional regulator